MKTSLETEVCGIKFKNPIIVASGPPTRNADYLVRSFESGAGGAVAKTVSDNKALRIYLRPRFTILQKSGYPEVFSNYSSEFASPQTVREMANELKKAKKRAEKLGSILIGSIMASSIPSWQEMAKKMKDAGVDMLELWLGGRIGGLDTALMSMTYAEYCEEVSSAVTDVINLPVFAKLTTDGVDVLEVGRRLKSRGIHGLTLADRISALEIDLKTGRPILAGGFARVGGPWMRPVMLNWIAKVAKEIPLPISASGGFLRYQDALKAIMCGASTVQLCTALLYGKKGYKVIEDFTKGMTAYLSENKISSIERIKGKTLNQIRAFQDLERVQKGKVWCEIDPETCDLCKLCLKRCYFDAIKSEKRKVVILKSKCDGCGLCLILCHKNAIRLIGKSEILWGDFS